MSTGAGGRQEVFGETSGETPGETSGRPNRQVSPGIAASQTAFGRSLGRLGTPISKSSGLVNIRQEKERAGETGPLCELVVPSLPGSPPASLAGTADSLPPTIARVTPTATQRARPPLDANTFTGDMQWAVRWFNLMTEADRIGSIKHMGMARFWNHAKRGDYGAAQEVINEIWEAIGC